MRRRAIGDAPPALDLAPASRRFVHWTWAVCGAAGVAAGIVMSIQIGHVFGMAVAPIVALSLGLVVLTVRWIVRRRSVDAIRDLVVPAALLFGILAAREGVFGHWLSFDLTWFKSSRHDEWNVKTSTHSMSATTTWTSGEPHPGEDAPQPRNRKRTFTVTPKSGDGQVARALRATLSAQEWNASDVSVDVKFDAPDSWHLVPLYKHGVVKCTADVKATWKDGPDASGDVSADMKATIDLTIIGFATRRTFNDEIGETIARKVAETVNAAIDKAK